jgi:hypothetical protein
LWQLGFCGGDLFKMAVLKRHGNVRKRISGGSGPASGIAAPKVGKTHAVRRCSAPLNARNPARSAQASREKNPLDPDRPGGWRRLARRIPPPLPARPVSADPAVLRQPRQAIKRHMRSSRAGGAPGHRP